MLLLSLQGLKKWALACRGQASAQFFNPGSDEGNISEKNLLVD